jgi:hypothetical protein
MSVDPEKQQEDLQKMLALKRHETPPPRFFSGFSDKVIDGLREPEPTGPRTVWQRLGLDIDGRPVLVCASGVAVCAMLGTGIILALQMGPARPVPRPPLDPSQWVVAPAPTSQPASGDVEALPVVAGPPANRLDQPVIVPSQSSLTAVKAGTQPVAEEKQSPK